MRAWFFVLGAAACATTASAPAALRLDRVVLYQNGIGHFERAGSLPDRHLRLVLRPHEVDDVIKTLTVIDRAGHAQQVAAVLPTPDQTEQDRVVVDIVLSRPVRDLVVSYAVPTATWKTTYRVAMPDKPGAPLLLQSWAMIDNLSEESWDNVKLSLATGAPLSFATDLRTPHFVPRPDATGALVAPTATAIVTADRTRGHEENRDGDGILDEVDMCPDDPEDRDGFGDDDGCPDADNDQDRVRDEDDRCPMEPETFNGFEDEDGCPDRGRVILTASRIEIMDRIYFGAGEVRIPTQAYPILDAVTATLQGNPQITTLVIGGHAAVGEDDPWGLSARRAGTIRAYLADHGVKQQLEVRAFGDTMPLGEVAEQNRRVEFEVGHDRGPPPRAAEQPITRTALAASARSGTVAVEVAGASRYQLADRVTVPRGASTLVSVLSRDVDGADVLIFRPDQGTPGSDLHPYRAARIALPVELGLEPGPVAVFAEGSFAGEGLMQRTPGGQVTYVPFALDGGTTVRVATTGDERPLRLVAVARGVATVQNAMVKRTVYTVLAAPRSPSMIYLRHTPAPGYELASLPPGSERGERHVLVALPLSNGKTSTVTVEERQPVTRQLELLDDGGANLAAYVDGADLPAPVLAAVRVVVAARAELADVELEGSELRDAIADATEHAGDLERSVSTVQKLPGAEAAELRKRLLTNLTTAAGRVEILARQIAANRARQVEARVKLQTAIEALGLEQLVSPAVANSTASRP